MGGRGEGWVYSVNSAVLDSGTGRRLEKERNEPIEMTVICELEISILFKI